MADSPALLIVGPAAAGKSTVGELTAGMLGVPFVDLDEIGAGYYAEAGWSMELLGRRIARVGRVAAEREWEPARAHAVCRAVEEHPGTVLAVGAGHTSYTDPSCREQVQSAVARIPTVVLLLPSGDRMSDLAELRMRSLAAKGTDWVSSGHDFLAEWLDDVGTRLLATDTVLTQGDRPEVTARRVALLVRSNLPHRGGPGRKGPAPVP